jgi:catechol 2,3-dioxygenase-like lactoylglutathione lyase family enzyme
MKTTSFYLVILLTFQYVSIMAQSANPFTNAVQFRIARPTSQLHKIKTFYCEVLGFPLIGHFEGHDGYDGLMVGIPNEKYHLEFTQHAKQSDLPKPTRENLLVFYFEDDTSYLAANQRLQVSGYQPVAPENPYWADKSFTYEDQDGWRIVLFKGLFKSL